MDAIQSMLEVNAQAIDGAIDNFLRPTEQMCVAFYIKEFACVIAVAQNQIAVRGRGQHVGNRVFITAQFAVLCQFAV